MSAPAVVAADAFWLEPLLIKTHTIRLARGKPAHRFVHFTDLHHKGDQKLLRSLIRKINAAAPEFVCFTGDIVEDTRFPAEALDGLRQIKSPLYGTPGNHDYWNHADFDIIARAFATTGGKWLIDESVLAANSQINIFGAKCTKIPQPVLDSATKNIMLIHYPNWIDGLAGYKFDLVLAGHSHGGQVHIPFFGPLIHTFNAERYNLGLYQTASGPLYVGSGIGWFYLPIRFNCRPEIVVFEI